MTYERKLYDLAAAPVLVHVPPQVKAKLQRRGFDEVNNQDFTKPQNTISAKFPFNCFQSYIY